MKKKIILINALGIIDSGGISVLDKLLNECTKNKLNSFYIVCNCNKNIQRLIEKFRPFKNFEFKRITNKSFLYRIYYENFVIKRYAESYADLIYNFSGSFLYFVKKPQIVKVQNLIFYSKKLDSIYKKNGRYLSWIFKIYIKRLLFIFFLKNAKHIEIQSNHVANHLRSFIDIKCKILYVKSDVDIAKNEFFLPKQYDFSKKINFLYVVGPHFEYLHKNIIDFTSAMVDLSKKGINFEINITLTNRQLASSRFWDSSLNTKTNFLGYIDDQEKMKELFCENTILISTSVIETLGLHVIEGIKHGIIAIVPDEEYANVVYGGNVFKYELFNKKSLVNIIMKIVKYNGSLRKKVLSIQDDIKRSEGRKFGSILDIFDEVINV